MARNMGLLLSAVFASKGEVYCVLERERVFLRRYGLGSVGYLVEGSCSLK